MTLLLVMVRGTVRRSVTYIKLVGNQGACWSNVGLCVKPIEAVTVDEVQHTPQLASFRPCCTMNASRKSGATYWKAQHGVLER